MANESAILDRSLLSQSAVQLPDYMPAEEMYRVTRGISKDWGMEHYDPPKKPATYHRIKYTIPQAMRRTMSELKPRIDTNVPGPGKYEKEMKFSLISNIHKPLLRAAKNSFITDIMRAPPRPGPGSYFQTSKGKLHGATDDPHKIRGPVIDKSFGHNFVSESQYRGEQSPGPGSYEVDVLSKSVQFQRQTPGFQKAKPLKHPKVAEPGPGHYYRKDYRASSKDSNPIVDPIRPRPPRPVIGKGNPPTAIEIRAKQTKLVPGVGAYKDYLTPTEAFISDPKKIHFAMALAKDPRFPGSQTSLSCSKGPGYYSLEDDEDELKKG